jgi:hypothetical protein
MTAWTTPLALALCLASASSYAADANLGRWKLNEAKSKIPKATQKNTRVIYETASGDRLKATVDGVDKDGNPIHNEWMGKADGKDYVVLGDPTTDTRSLTKVDDLHYTVVSKKGGAVTVTGKVSFSKDLKTRTLVLTGKTPDGKPLTGTWVYERQ